MKNITLKDINNKNFVIEQSSINYFNCQIRKCENNASFSIINPEKEFRNSKIKGESVGLICEKHAKNRLIDFNIKKENLIHFYITSGKNKQMILMFVFQDTLKKNKEYNIPAEKINKKEFDKIISNGFLKNEIKKNINYFVEKKLIIDSPRILEILI